MKKSLAIWMLLTGFSPSAELEWIWMEPTLSFIQGETVRYAFEFEALMVREGAKASRSNTSRTTSFLIAEKSPGARPQYVIDSGDPAQPPGQVGRDASTVFDQLSNLLPPRPVQIGEAFQKERGLGIADQGPPIEKIVIDQRGELTQRVPIKQLTGKNIYDGRVVGWELVENHPCLLIEGSVQSKYDETVVVSQWVQMAYSPFLGRVVLASVSESKRGASVFRLLDPSLKGRAAEFPAGGGARVEIPAVPARLKDRAKVWLEWIRRGRVADREAALQSLSLKSWGEGGFVETTPGHWRSAEALRRKVEVLVTREDSSDLAERWREVRACVESWDAGRQKIPVFLERKRIWPAPVARLGGAFRQNTRGWEGPREWTPVQIVSLASEGGSRDWALGWDDQRNLVWRANGDAWGPVTEGAEGFGAWSPVWMGEGPRSAGGGRVAFAQSKTRVSGIRMGEWPGAEASRIETRLEDEAPEFGPWQAVKDWRGEDRMFWVGQKKTGGHDLVWSAWDVWEGRWRFHHQPLVQLKLPEGGWSKARARVEVGKGGRRVAMAFSSGVLLGADGETGDVLWIRRFEKDLLARGSGMSVSENVVVWWDASDLTATGFDLESGEEIWKRTSPPGSRWTGADRDRVLLWEKKRLVAVDTARGVPVWAGDSWPDRKGPPSVWEGKGRWYWAEGASVAVTEASSGRSLGKINRTGPEPLGVVEDPAARDRVWVITPSAVEEWKVGQP